LVLKKNWRKKMFKKTLALAVLCTAAIAVATPAEARGGQRSIEHIYEQCGIGGLIFGHISPIIAIISNVTWDLGTTAVLSGTLSPDACGGVFVARAVLIKEDFPAIEQDLASGRGEHLAALNKLMACPSASKNLRTDYAQYTTSPNYQESDRNANAEQLFRIVNDNIDAAHCSAA
jgi:hypothetical protein